MRMPATGMSATPRTGTSPVSSSAPTTGSTPGPIGTAAQRQVRLAAMRRPAVHTATANISATNPRSGATERTTQPMSRETAASWAAARTPATRISRDRPSEAHAATAAARTNRTARTTPRVTETGSNTRQR